MSKIKAFLGRTWIYAAAAALIIGSSTTMAFALNNNLTKGATENLVTFTAPIQENVQNEALKAQDTAEYTVTDLSKGDPERKDMIMDKLSKQENLTPEQIEENYKAIIAAMTPGEKDISAQQAAAYAAGILKKAYEVDFTGYTAQASFSRSPVPGSDSWTVIFHAPQENEGSTRYVASVDSVNGTMLDASAFNLDFRNMENSSNLEDPEWKNRAVEKISKLLPENVTITGSKIVFATPETGVMVVCELSDGSALATRLTGENKEAAVYIYFPNGYDGSLDYKPITENGVG